MIDCTAWQGLVFHSINRVYIRFHILLKLLESGTIYILAHVTLNIFLTIVLIFF